MLRTIYFFAPCKDFAQSFVHDMYYRIQIEEIEQEITEETENKVRRLERYSVFSVTSVFSC
jgi:hypothetical protein